MPEWSAEVDLTIGLDSSHVGWFVDPIPLGTDEDGRIYVIDRRLREIQRFDETGRFMDVFVGSGEGPGEMRFMPWTSGLNTRGAWYTEVQTGRVHLVSFDGSQKSTAETGWTLGAHSATDIGISLVSDSTPGQYMVQVESRDPATGGELRPGTHTYHGAIG